MEQKEIVKKWLIEIGYTILTSLKKQTNGEYKSRWNEKRIKEASLGYNDAQQLVVFSTNIPTYSITAFGQMGTIKHINGKGFFKEQLRIK